MSSSGQAIETVTVTGNRALQAFAGPECYVDVYPFEGGSFTLSGGNILSLTTSKAIKQDVGSFAFQLAPDFVAANSSVSWPQVITPMSTVVIGMRRGSLSAVTMVGVVTSCTSTEIWSTGNSTARAYMVNGVDLAYFFTFFDFFTLWYLAILSGGVPDTMFSGLLQGDPSAVGQNWYNVMASNQGVFANTIIPFNGGQIPLPNVLGTFFEKYDTLIPYGDYFIGANGPWYNKFRGIFPAPFYEFFITTVFGNNYPGASGGASFFNKTLGNSVTSTVAVIARLNPLPRLVSSLQGNLASFDSIDTSVWDALPAMDMRGSSPIGNTPTFDEAEVFNFFAINPSWAFGQNGDSNTNVTPALFTYSVAVDKASIARYGYRPFIHNIPWFADLTGNVAVNAGSNATQIVAQSRATLFGRLAGYYEPTPLMAKSLVTMQLRPDLVPGVKFTYIPFHDNEPWDFYVEGVTHQFIFGGQSTTKLALSRGLPSSVYADSNLLLNIHIGNAQRLNGEYQIGAVSTQPTLQALSLQDLGNWVSQRNNLYRKPQGLM